MASWSKLWCRTQKVLHCSRTVRGVKVFVGNFQGTYVRPRNSWDLRSCRQKPDESLRDFIRRFSKQCTELPNITDSDVIGAFITGTTCKELVHELGRKTPTSTS